MARFLKSRIKAKGAAPGSLIFIGSQKMERSRVRLIQFNENENIESEFENIDDALNAFDEKYINWLNIDGLHDTELIKKTGKFLDISPLALENILNTDQHQKYFEDQNNLTVVTKSIYVKNPEEDIDVEQISFVLGKKFVVSFQERVGDQFEPIRERIRKGIGRVRYAGSDYLLYTLMDCLVDNYLVDIEKVGNEIEKLENHIFTQDRSILDKIFHYKTETAFLRKNIRPLREVMTRLLRTDTALVKKENRVYFQELNHLVEHSLEAIENYISMSGDQLNIYTTNISNRANDVMKVLTIFASIFIPLTFIVGVYGTNFDYLPELHFKYSYFVMWGVMVVVSILMLLFFKRRKWF